MERSGLRFLAAAVLFSTAAVCAAQSSAPAPPQKMPPSDDPRALVSMPGAAQALMRQDMLDHLAALSEILGLLAAGDLAKTAEVGETRLGRGSMGKYRASGMGPGRFMPLEMRNIGWAMHDAASEFAAVASKGDAKAAREALQKVTSMCVVCHYAFRTR